MKQKINKTPEKSIYKQKEDVRDIVKLCDDLRLLIPVYGPLSNTEIMLDVLEDAVNHATAIHEEVSYMSKLEKNEGLK